MHIRIFGRKISAGTLTGAFLCTVALTFSTACGSGGRGDRVGGGGGAGSESPDVDDGTKRAHTFTSYADFTSAAAVTNGVNVDVTGKLQLSTGINLFRTPFIWISNSSENSVSRIDTHSQQLTGPFALTTPEGEPCYNPSRTTVDMDGNVWLGCRGTDSYLESTAQVTPAMVPEKVDQKVMKVSKDGDVLLSIKVGYAPRSLSLDSQGNVWIGCSVDDTVWKLNGDTGECLIGDGDGCAAPAIVVGNFPYGSVIDQRGHLWVVSTRDDRLSDIDTYAGALVQIHGPYNRPTCGGGKELYGIAVDQLNNIWMGGWDCSDVVKVKGVDGLNPADGISYTSGQMIGSYDSGGEVTRGLAIDLDGNVWVANSGTNNASKLQGATGTFIRTVSVGRHPIGVGIDADGNAWVVNKQSDSVHRINGLDSDIKDEISVGRGPYTYSDMLGLSLRNITHRAEQYGTWTVVVDSQIESPKWSSIAWQAEVPTGTSVKVQFRCAATEAGLATAPWGDLLDAPGDISCDTPSARYGQVEARLYPTPGGMGPVLGSLTAKWVE